MIKILYQPLAGLLAVFFFMVSCSKNEIISPANTPDITQSKSSATVPPSLAGDYMIEAITYVDQFEIDIQDSTKYCPIEFAGSGVKDYSESNKLLNRLIYFYESKKGITINKSFLESVIQHQQNASISDLKTAGITQKEIDLMDDYDTALGNSNLIPNLQTATASFQTAVNNSQLSNLDKERMLAGADINADLFALTNSGPNYILDDLSDDLLGIPCGWATVFYAAALISVCAVTAGAGAVVVAATWVGFGGSIWGLTESC